MTIGQQNSCRIGSTETRRVIAHTLVAAKNTALASRQRHWCAQRDDAAVAGHVVRHSPRACALCDARTTIRTSAIFGVTRARFTIWRFERNFHNKL